MSCLPLVKLLQYKNDHVMARYQSDYPGAQLRPEEAFAEWLKFVWLCHDHANALNQRPNDESLKFDCVIHVEMIDIDNMWHTFLLFTLDYHDFCTRYLNGQFFHHLPLTAKAEAISAEKYKSDLSNYLSYIYDRLGEATLIKWFGQRG